MSTANESAPSSLDPEAPLARRLTEAIGTGDAGALRALLREHPALATARIGDPGAGQSRTLLHLVTDWPGHVPDAAAKIAALVSAGADVNARFTGPHTETPLHWAASADDIEALDALLDAGADIEAGGAVIGGGTPLADAVAFGQWKAAERLLERGARTTLWQAAALGLVDRVRDELARTPPAQRHLDNALWCAAHGGRRETAELLLERGADPAWVGHDGLTAAQAAERSDAHEVAAWLGRAAERRERRGQRGGGPGPGATLTGSRGGWAEPPRGGSAAVSEVSAGDTSPTRAHESPAAGVVAAARARVARAGALHHPAALAARRAEVEAGEAGRDDGRRVGEGGGRGLRGIHGRRRRGEGLGAGGGRRRAGAGCAVAVAVAALRRAGRVAAVRRGGGLGRLARPDLRGEDAELLLRVDVEEARRQPAHDVVGHRLREWDLRVGGDPLGVEAHVAELLDERLERHAVLQRDRDRRRERVHHAAEGRALLADVGQED